MLDGRPRRRIWWNRQGLNLRPATLQVATLPTELQFHKCEVGVLTVIKGVGELRYNTLTKQEVMHVFLWV